MKTNQFILKTFGFGLKLLSISDLQYKKFNIQDFLEAKDDSNTYTDSLQV